MKKVKQFSKKKKISIKLKKKNLKSNNKNKNKTRKNFRKKFTKSKKKYNKKRYIKNYKKTNKKFHYSKHFIGGSAMPTASKKIVAFDFDDTLINQMALSIFGYADEESGKWTMYSDNQIIKNASNYKLAWRLIEIKDIFKKLLDNPEVILAILTFGSSVAIKKCLRTIFTPEKVAKIKIYDPSSIGVPEQIYYNVLNGKKFMIKKLGEELGEELSKKGLSLSLEEIHYFDDKEKNVTQVREGIKENTLVPLDKYYGYTIYPNRAFFTSQLDKATQELFYGTISQEREIFYSLPNFRSQLSISMTSTVIYPPTESVKYTGVDFSLIRNEEPNKYTIFYDEFSFDYKEEIISYLTQSRYEEKQKIGEFINKRGVYYIGVYQYRIKFNLEEGGEIKEISVNVYLEGNNYFLHSSKMFSTMQYLIHYYSKNQIETDEVIYDGICLGQYLNKDVPHYITYDFEIKYNKNSAISQNSTETLYAYLILLFPHLNKDSNSKLYKIKIITINTKFYVAGSDESFQNLKRLIHAYQNKYFEYKSVNIKLGVNKTPSAVSLGNLMSSDGTNI